MSSDKYVLHYTSRMTPRQVGGKFEKQSRMIRSGIAVPHFFCLTAAFFEEVVAPLRPSIQSLLDKTDFGRADDIERSALRVQDLFMAVQLNAVQQERIRTAFDRLFSDNPLVSVRSSMIGYKAEESEDSADNPFAGMSESFLYVRREDIVKKALLCMASGFRSESMLYRRKHGMDLMGFSVAVGVQRMIAGSRSFVLFTCDPKTAARQTIIVAGYGIGEGVVQEKVPVDHFFLNPMTDEIRTKLADKDRMLTISPDAHGIASQPVEPELRHQPCLSADQIRTLSGLGSRIERLFNAPQDIEGTITPEGSIHILQSRPIAMDRRRQRVWTNANVTESFPGVTTPLTFTLARYFYRVIFYDCYRMLGVSRKELHDRDEQLDRMIGFLGGRVYYCLTSFYLLHSQSPLFPIFRAHWEKMMGFLSSYEIGSESLLLRAAARTRAAVRFLKAAVVIMFRYGTHERDLARFHRWWEQLIAPRRGRSWENHDPILLIADFHDVWRQVGKKWGITLMNDTYLPVIHGWVEGLFKKWNLSSGPEGEALLSGLLCGDDGLVSVEIILSAVHLAEQARNNPALARQLEMHSPEELWRKLDSGELDPSFSEAVQRHLHVFGDRGFQELKMEQPSLRQTPSVLLRMIQSYLKEGLTVEAYRQKERRVREEAEAELQRRLAGRPFRRRLARTLLAKLRRLILNRENSRYCRSELFSYSRSIFEGIASHLLREGVLHRADDIFFLTQDEIFGFIDGTGVTENLQALADLRRAEGHEHRKHETHMQITTMGAVRQNGIFTEPAVATSSDVLRGLGSSAGKVRGTARVVIDPNQPVDLGDDGILVARETDPGWLFLMLSAKGIIVERGSMLSHTAITGRKFGIPTVVALPDATTRIPDGARIELDGAGGIVRILHDSERAHSAD